MSDQPSIIFVFRNTVEEELRDIGWGATRVIALDKAHIPNQFHQFVEVVDQKLLAQLDQEFRQRIIASGQIEIHGKTIASQLQFGGKSLFFPIRFNLFYKHRYFAREFLLFEQFGEGIKRIYTANSIWTNVAVPQTEVRLRSEYAKGTKSKFSLLRYAAIFLVRAIIGLVKAPFSKKHRHLILYSNYYRLPVMSIDGSISPKGDPFLGLFYDRVGDDSLIQTLMIMKNPGDRSAKFPFRDQLFPPKNIKNYGYFELYLMLALLNPSTWLKLRRFHSQNRQYLAHGSHLNALDQALITFVKKNLVQFELSIVKMIAAQYMLRHLKPLSVGGEDEYGFAKRPILQMAEKIGTPTFGIQHGEITELDINYSFVQADQELFPICDRTAVWGSIFADKLISKSIYSPLQLEITGQSRADLIPMLLNRKSKSPTSGKLRVLFASQPFIDFEVRKKYLRDITMVAREMPEIDFVIKPHPNEIGETYFDDIATELNHAIQLNHDDLYEQLAGADVVITYFSTVGAEAVLFGKHLIVFDYHNEDPSGYVKAGIAWNCNSIESVITTIKGIAAGNLTLDPQHREKYIHGRAFRIDGQSTERLHQFVLNSSKGQRL